jgi:hypothetical protein
VSGRRWEPPVYDVHPADQAVRAATTGAAPDVYGSEREGPQLLYDRLPSRASLYTNIKDDHPADWLTGEPCDCEAGGTAWERGTAMAVRWPQAQLEAGQ